VRQTLHRCATKPSMIEALLRDHPEKGRLGSTVLIFEAVSLACA
jgi:hypothetical protein